MFRRMILLFLKHCKDTSWGEKETMRAALPPRKLHDPFTGCEVSIAKFEMALELFVSLRSPSKGSTSSLQILPRLGK